MIGIKIDPRQLEEAQKVLAGFKSGVKKVTASALNNTLPGVRTEITNQLSGSTSDYSFKRGPIFKRIDLSRRPTKGEMLAGLRMSGKRMNLTDFPGTKQTSTGVEVNVKKSTGPQELPGFFINKAPRSGKRLVLGRPRNKATGRRYARYGEKGTGGKAWDNRPQEKGNATLLVRYAPAPEMVISTGENLPEVQTKISTRLAKELDRQIDRLLKIK
ncbi:MAG: hypothetical protein U5J62_06385 [Desulfurivibrio sp.]|nr:hypothetical protein [Desulfurivibrio sp.]